MNIANRPFLIRVRERLIGFLVSWLGYFLAIAAMATVGVLVIGPALAYLRTGEVSFVDSNRIWLIAKAVLISSFWLTVVMWIAAQLMQGTGKNHET